MKKKFSIALSVLLLLGSVGLTSCGDSTTQKRKENVFRIASWDEYICMGGEDSYAPDSKPLYEEFETWYNQQHPDRQPIEVEYVALQDNETMYSKIKMGDFYDILCPSEYMIMKLAAENKLQELPASFHDASIEHNYYAKYISPYIDEQFRQGKIENSDKTWRDYAAGYMWGTTGFVFNPENISPSVMNRWSVLTSEECSRKITAKDNVRDSYFIGLGMYYEDDLLALKTQYENGEIDKKSYQAQLGTYMNDTRPQTMGKVKEKLIDMRKNLYGLETDEAKLEVSSGRLDASFQWSGDAVYILDQAEENDLSLHYSVPESASNLWFDGWVMMKGANVEVSTAFINFLSRPDNVVRNMYYIGYTSCIAGNATNKEIFNYIQETYADDEGDITYDLSYFFGEGHSFTTTKEQTQRQLFAQYPDVSTIDRLVIMKYFDAKTNERANRMWTSIK